MSGNYRIEAAQHQGVKVYVLSCGDGARAEIAPAWGNNCFAFSWSGVPILEPVTFESIAQKPTSYGVPILFPYPNRIRDGKFSFQGRQYQLNPPRHGFVRDKPWKVTASGASQREGAWLSCLFRAGDYPEQILSQFPFPFTLEVTYRLFEDALVMETRAENLGSETMPLGLGTHAYFRRPVEGTLQVPANQLWELEESLPTGQRIDAEGLEDLRSPANVAALELDHIYTDLDADEDGTVRCSLLDARERVETIVEFDVEEFPEVVIYTAPPPRQAICIEPYTCPTDAFNLASKGIDAHLIRLPAGQSIDWTMRVRARYA